MALSAIDIEQKTFRVALRGYAEEEVDAFLDEIISTVRSLEQQLQDARARAADLESRVSDNRDSEDRITRTLVLAQKTADEVVREARFEAQQILSQARLDASEIEADQVNKKEQLGLEVTTLQNAVADLRSHVKGLTERLLAQVDETEAAMGGIAPIDEPVEEEEDFGASFVDTDDEEPASFEASEEEPSDEDVDVDLDDMEDEANMDEPSTGEVYLGSDRRPWERYGD